MEVMVYDSKNLFLKDLYINDVTVFGVGKNISRQWR